MSITNIINYLKTNLHLTDITLGEGASEELIAKVEATYSIILPEDIKEFYRFTNGFESAEDIFRIIPLEEMIENETKSKDAPLEIAEYLIYIDGWYLQIDPTDSSNYEIFTTNPEDIVLTNSFAEFLQKFLDGGVFEKGGLYDWASELTNNVKTNL